MTWVAVGATAISVGTKVYSGIQAKKAKNKQDAFNNQNRNDLTSMFNKDYYQNYLDTEGSRAALGQVQKNMKEASKITANSAVQGGATPEAVIAQSGNLQDKYQNAINGIVQVGQGRKDQNMWRFQSLKQGLDAGKNASLAGDVSKWGTFNDNMDSATGGIMNAFANGAFDKTEAGIARKADRLNEKALSANLSDIDQRYN